MRSSLATRFWLFFFSSFFIVLLCPKPWVPWQFQTRTKKTKKALLLLSMETQLDLVLNQLRLCRNHQQIMVSLFRHIFQSMYLSKYVGMSGPMEHFQIKWDMVNYVTLIMFYKQQFISNDFLTSLFLKKIKQQTSLFSKT